MQADRGMGGRKIPETVYGDFTWEVEKHSSHVAFPRHLKDGYFDLELEGMHSDPLRAFPTNGKFVLTSGFWDNF